MSVYESPPNPSADAVSRPVLIEIDSVTRSFGDVCAVDEVSLTVTAGTVLGLLGHNGAGKTTLIRLITGLLAPDSGRVRAFDHDPITDGSAVRSRLGVLPSSSIVDTRLTAAENMGFAARIFGIEPDLAARRTAELLESFELSDRADDLVETYSAGMRQRLSLARVLLADPEVLLLDEPTSAMDPVGARDFLDVLAGFVARDERAIVVCTHDLSEAATLCTDIAVLSEGSVVARGAPSDLTRAIDVPTVVTVAPEAVERAIRIVATVDPAAEATSDGTVNAPGLTRDAVPGLVERLVHAGVAIYGIEQASATLEDVYFDLHRPTLITDHDGTAASRDPEEDPS